MSEVINPIIRGWGNYYRKANVRKLFHRLDGWIERRLWSFISKRWRNTAWRRYPTSCLIADFGLVRLIHLVPGIRPKLRQPARPTGGGGWRENCTPLLSHRSEAGRKPHLSRRYSDE